MKPIYKTLVLLLPILCLVLTPHAAHAVSTGLTIQPIKVSVTLNPGDNMADVIHITNSSDGDVNVDITVQDFVPVAGQDSLKFVGKAPGVTSVADWITIPGSHALVFKQGESKDVPYSIVAPANAEPGGHFGAIFFKATPAGQTGTLKVGTQVGMLVLVTIPGSHLEKGQILDFKAPSFVQQGPVSFTMKFQNTGTVHFEPKGKIVISNMFGKKVAEVPIQGQIVLPTSIKDLGFDWNVTGILLGKYTAAATVVDGEGTVLTTKEVSFWAVPVWYVMGYLTVFIIVFLVLRFLKNKVKISLK